MSKFLDSAKRYSFFINIILIIFIIILASLYSSLASQYKKVSQELNQQEKTPPADQTPAEKGAGEVGEVLVKDENTGEEKPKVDVFTPPIISNTFGDIKEVNKDYIIVKGFGDNFADKVARDLKVVFTDQTITFDKNQINSYRGEEGLLHLKVGMRILIESNENIRGKTEFEASIINIKK